MIDETLKAPTNRRVRVLVVDDSAFMRTAITRMVASEPYFDVVGSVSSGEEALQRLPALNPDVITLDIEMPGIGGLQTLRNIMNQFPRPVIIVSSIAEKAADVTLAALQAGAFDYVPKQLSAESLDIAHIRADLIAKIKAAAQARISSNGAAMSHETSLVATPHEGPTIAIVAVGVSTGGPKALQDMLPTLPADLPVPLLIVQHMPSGFTGPFARRLDTLCSISVREAGQQDVARPGVAYIAPAGLHLTIARSGSKTVLCLSDKPENQLHTPSIDIMMRSVATAFGSQAMGVIMTGMGSDGAQGMQAIHREGGFTIGQDQRTSAVYGMPGACAEMGVLDRIVPLSQIPREIVQAARLSRKANAG